MKMELVTQNVDEDKIDSRTGWTVEATNSLIKVYKETKSGKGRTLWNNVAEKMQELGYKVTPHQCDQRFSVIKGRYYRVTEGLAKGRASTKMTSFPYLLALSDVLPVRKQASANDSDDEEWCKLPKKKTKWSKEEENAFLTILKAKMIEQASAQIKKPMQEIWGEISQELGYRNYFFTAINCEQKWLHLVKQYKRIESGAFQAEEAFDNYYIVMEIYQWFPQDYLSKTSFFSKPSTGETRAGTLAPCVWTDDATVEFLNLMEERKTTFYMYKKKSIWIEISKCMKEKGFSYTPSNIECKWKSMKAKYRKDMGTALHGAVINTPFFKEISELIEYIEKTHDEELIDEGIIKKRGNTDDGDAELDISAGDDKIPAGWSPHACECLLKLILERKEIFGTERILKGLWEEISRILKEWGFDYDGVQCGSKWKTMKRSYLKVEENNARPGAPKKIIPFYDQIKELNAIRENAEFEVSSGGVEKTKKKPATELDIDDFSESGEDSLDEDDSNAGDLPPKASNWTHESIIHLINNYKDVFLKVKKGLYNSKMFWKTVHHRMKKTGYNMSVTSCRRKMHKLRAMFVRKTRKTLENFDEFSDSTWPYYHAMRSLLILRRQYDNKNPLPQNSSTYGFDDNFNSSNIDFETKEH